GRGCLALSSSSVAVRASPSRLRILYRVMQHLDLSEFLPDNRFPSRAAGDCNPAAGMGRAERADPLAALASHRLIPFRDLAWPDRECLTELAGVGAERGTEEQGLLEPFILIPVERDEDSVFKSQAGKILLVVQHFGPPAALVTPVEEPALGDPVPQFKGRCMPEQGPVTGEQLRVTAAAFVHQLPERAVNDGLPDPGDLGKGHVQVMECKQAFPV